MEKCSRNHVTQTQLTIIFRTLPARSTATPVRAQTFPNLSCVHLLDNDIRSLKQFEGLRPILRGLASLHLGKNPLSKNTSTAALRAWVRAQSPGLRLVLPDDDLVGGGQKSGPRHPSTSPGRSAQPVGTGHHGPPLPPTAQRPHPPPGGGERNTGPPCGGSGREENAGGRGTVDPPSVGLSASAGTAPGDAGWGGGVDGRGFPAGVAPTTRVDAAFERLAQARSRAASSSWGAVALARLTAAENRVGVAHGVGGAATRDSAGAWAASGRGAQLACNGMVCVLRSGRDKQSSLVKFSAFMVLLAGYPSMPFVNQSGFGSTPSFLWYCRLRSSHLAFEKHPEGGFGAIWTGRVRAWHAKGEGRTRPAAVQFNIRSRGFHSQRRCFL